MTRLIRLLTIFMLVMGGSLIAAQEITPEPVPTTPPELMTITPATLPHGQGATVTLNGAHFTSDTDVTVESLGDVDCTFISDTQMSIAIPATLGSGQYDIRVSNASGTSQLLDALTIQSEPTPVRVSINRTEPATITAGQSGVLSVQGMNFTQATVVRLAGVGLLPTTYLHSGALTATLPETLLFGEYGIDVVDPVNGTATAATRLRVLAAPIVLPTPQPLPTPNPTSREPSLSLTRVSASPNPAQPGQAITLSFTVSNRGNQTARLIGITLGDTTDVALAAGQTSLSVPDLLPGGSYNGQLAINVSRAVESEVVSVPLVVTYRDPENKAYTDTVRTSVTISYTAQLAQLVIDAYTFDPQRIEAGENVTLRMTIANRGTVDAAQVMLRIAGENSVLLPNGASDMFFVGAIASGQRAPLELTLRASSKATAGVQSQPVTLLYLQDNEAKEQSTSIALDVIASRKPQPQVLVSRYEIDQDTLQPGSRFTLTAYLQNVGGADATDMVLTFGTVQSTTSPDTGTPPDPTNPNSNTGGSQSSAPSTTFAPLNSTGIVYVGELPMTSEPLSVEQAFIVSGATSSGIYSLPVTLRYALPDGTTKQDNLSISLVVVAPPRLLINPANPLPEMMLAGEPLPVTLTLKNAGLRNVNLTDAAFDVTNGEIVEGAETILQTLKAGEETTVTAVIVAQEEGAQIVTARILYLDEINQPQTIELVYESQVTLPEPPPVDEPPVEPPVEPTPEPVDWFGRLMLALLGLGS